MDQEIVDFYDLRVGRSQQLQTQIIRRDYLKCDSTLINTLKTNYQITKQILELLEVSNSKIYDEIAVFVSNYHIIEYKRNQSPYYEFFQFVQGNIDETCSITSIFLNIQGVDNQKLYLRNWFVNSELIKILITKAYSFHQIPTFTINNAFTNDEEMKKIILVQYAEPLQIHSLQQEGNQIQQARIVLQDKIRVLIQFVIQRAKYLTQALIQYLINVFSPLTRIQRREMILILKQLLLENIWGFNQVISEIIIKIDDQPCSLIQQLFVLSKSELRLDQLYQDYNLDIQFLMENYENVTNLNKLRLLVQSYQKFQILNLQNHSFTLDIKQIDRAITLFPKYWFKLLEHLSMIDRVQTSQVILKITATQFPKNYKKVSCQDEDLLPLFIRRDQLQDSGSKYLLYAIKNKLLNQRRESVSINICVHLINCLSESTEMSEKDYLICSLLHQVFIQELQLIDKIIFQVGFPERCIQKMVNHVEALHITLKEAEKIIDSVSSQDKGFIFNFFRCLTDKYKNERSDQIKQYLNQLAKKYPYYFKQPKKLSQEIIKTEVVKVF